MKDLRSDIKERKGREDGGTRLRKMDLYPMQPISILSFCSPSLERRVSARRKYDHL